MSSHDKALEKKKKHTHKKSKDDKCEICNMVMGDEGEVDDKGKEAKTSYSFNKNEGAKNNDSEED